MKELLDELETLIRQDVAGAQDWTIRKYAPKWTDEHDGKTLYIHRGQRTPAPWVTAARMDSVEILFEFAAPADAPPGGTERDVDAEHELLEEEEALVAWIDGHQALTATWWKFDFTRSLSPAELRRRSKLCRFVIIATAQKVSSYVG